MQNNDELLEIFVKRPYRFRLLEKGLKLAGMGTGCSGRVRLMESGCAYGDASAHVAQSCACRVTGIDCCADAIVHAERKHKGLIEAGVLEFLTQDAESLAFENSHFDGMFMEAAFSPIRNKKAAVSEIRRVLRPGGRVVVNDFAVSDRMTEGIPGNLSGIPCFRGVGRMDDYRAMFVEQGFREIHAADEYGEFITLALWVSKSFNIRLNEVGAYLAKYRNAGVCAPEPCADGGNGHSASGARLTYCQMIFEKR